MNHYPKTNVKYAADQFADPSRVHSQAYKDGIARVFGERPMGHTHNGACAKCGGRLCHFAQTSGAAPEQTPKP